MLGPHLVLDLYGCPKEKLEDVQYIYDLLDELPDMIGMQKIMPPYVMRYVPEDDPLDWGISGVVLIAESHIAIHTWPDLNYASVDIFSCKTFNIDKAKEIIEEKLSPERSDWEILVRGRDFPVNLLKRGKNGSV